MSRADGAGAAVIEAAQGAVSGIAAAPGGGAGEQLDFDVLPAGINEATPKGKGLAELVRRDRAGRPPGSQNKITKEMKDFCRKVFGDPMMMRFRYAVHTPESLAQLLGCSKLEAFDRLDKIWADLARYYYAQMAQVDGAGNAVVPQFNMQIGGRQLHVGTSRPPWEYLQELQQNQALPLSPEPVSHAAVSHGEAK